MFRGMASRAPWTCDTNHARPPAPFHARSDSEDSFTHTFEQVAAGTYTIRLTAINANSVSGTAATTGNLLVGEHQAWAGAASGWML